MIYCAPVFFVINHIQQLIHLLVFGIVHISVSSVCIMHTGIYSNAQSANLGKNSGLPGSSYDVSVHGVSMNDVGVSGIMPSKAHRPTCTSTKLQRQEISELLWLHSWLPHEQ